MSKAGIQSNRGDGYQTLVAFDWALTVLSDPDYQWIEVDSVTWSVDDVVIGKVDGTKICCQCKKNQTAFKAWTIANLADELQKASSLLACDPKAEVRFYSRSNFGELAALREYSTTYADASDYHVNLGKAHGKTDASLKKLLVLKAPNLSTYEFLHRTRFETTSDFDRMATLLGDRLHQLASNTSAVYNALWTRLDHLGMRDNSSNGQSAATQHRLTKEDLKSLVAQAGGMLTPPMDVVAVRASFKGTSAIGRSWRLHIGNERISRPLVQAIISAVDAKERSILLTGLPGSGKTCVVLAVQEELEQLARNRSDLVPLFIQSREFADMVTAQDRHAQGLPEQWVEKVARVAEDAHVVVVIDSLDVLSIAREHSVLTYFLAQIDRLLLVPNVTIITACRDFDRHYDLRIAHRTWAKEFACKPLGWDAEIAPLLAKLGIDSSATDAATRALIRNPRELALFVELAQQGGSFKVVTSQALAQRYLATFVQANGALGDTAMQSIEAISSDMLMSRSLMVPRQRFTASEDICRALLSLNVLHQTQDGKLTFGHQTLLDVLVISGAVRKGITLNAFIQGLPPVPFVRPSIRSFVAQLAAGDRLLFRGQLRTVLSGSHAFHIRRLVAECMAEQIPQDGDWPLIRDLRNAHRDVFQVIYTHAVRVEWHYFWLMHLIPVLRDTRDLEGLTTHAHQMSRWKNDDAAEVLKFWAEVLAMDGIDTAQIAWQLEVALSEVHEKYSKLVAPLLVTLLKLPRRKHSSLGRALARCVTAGGMDDTALWRYIANDVNNENVVGFNLGSHLHCKPHEFGETGDNFLLHRMQQSTALLGLALTSIEQWSQTKTTRFGGAATSYWYGFLRETSYIDAHNQTDFQHVDSERILFDAIEAAIIHHARVTSDWWQSNRERLCFNTEGALRYFAVLACTATPGANLDAIRRMLRDKAFLESDLSYELGTLIQSTLVLLDTAGQDAVLATILSTYQETAEDPMHRPWMMQEQAQLVVTIPCHLRSSAAQAVVDECEKSAWPLVRQPSIGMHGGMVSAPFSFQVFLAASDIAVLRLLAHYDGHTRNSFDDFPVGGEREVGSQLREAASRNPSRFLKLLPTYWANISDNFCDAIMEGVAAYLAHRHGNLQANGSWTPIEEPDAVILARNLLDELDRHPAYWHHNRAASNALQACAHVIQNRQDAGRLVFWAIDFSTLSEQSSISGDGVDLITVGINMARGHVVEALMILANQLGKITPWPELLAPALRRFAADEHPAIRAVLLQRLPYLQSHHPDLGWDLFECVMRKHAAGLWPEAERCLYYAYYEQFEIVAPLLARLSCEGSGKDLETWGRISALAALSKQLEFSAFLSDITAIDSAEAWRGATSVWTNANNMEQHREQCVAGLEAGSSADNQHAGVVALKIERLFRETSPPTSVPSELIKRCFAAHEANPATHKSDVYGFEAWLNATSQRDAEQSLSAAEIYLGFVRSAKPHLYGHGNDLTQLLTRLFAQSEEQEESDGGAMLRRVVALQDTMLALGFGEMNEWLKAAERP